MAGIIETWRTQETGWFSVDDGEAYAFAGEPDVDENEEKVSRAGSFPTPEVWLQIFYSALIEDFMWTEEDWKFVMNNLDKFPGHGPVSAPIMKRYLARYALDNSDLEDNILETVKKDRKLAPYQSAFLKTITSKPEIMASVQIRNVVTSVQFMLLMFGEIDDAIEDSVITKNNGFAGFVTEINKQVDQILKSGLEIKNKSYWDPSTGIFRYHKTNIEQTWAEWYLDWTWSYLKLQTGITLIQWAFGPDETEEKMNELRENLENILQGDFKQLETPRLVGKRIYSKAEEVLDGSSENTFIPTNRPEYSLYYNEKKIVIKKALTERNIDNPEILQALKDKIGAKETPDIVRLESGINDTNLFKWANEQVEEGEKNLFVPSFSKSPMFTGSGGFVFTEEQFASQFSFLDDEEELKKMISIWYSAAWYGYVFWFINQNENTSKPRRFNQLETSKLIAKQVAFGIASTIATLYDQYEKTALYLEAAVLLNYEEGEISPEELDSAIENSKNAADSSIENALSGGGIEEEEDLTEEELKERQKFVKQCILMYNLENLRDNYRDHIKAKIGNDDIHAKGPFNYRFHALNNTSPDDSANSLITRLQMPPQTLMKPLLDITPDIQAFLVPKIRLFRVNSTNIGMKETEFVFDKIEDKSRIDNLFNGGVEFDRGNSYGIKGFNFSFEGSNPATARNDITANLSLFFQSFQEIMRTRNHGQGEYRIIDLLVFPVNENNRQGTKTIRPDEYDPSYYRIRADVGWAIPENSPQLSKVLQNRGFEYEQLKIAILSTNKSFYLNAVDHEMDLKDDGSVEMKINYRAYAENALKTSKYDVLSSIQLRKSREEFKKAMTWAISDNNCSDEELDSLKELFQQAEEEIIKASYRSIMKRLNEKNKVFFVDVEEKDIKKFRKNGYFGRKAPPQLLGVNGSSNVVQQGSVVDTNVEQEASEVETDSNPPTLKLLKDGVQDYNPENLKVDNRINFFYLGDLIYTAMDSLYEQDGALRKDIEKTAFLLGSFDTADAFNSQQLKEFNIIDIPVSVQYFYEWFAQNVIKSKRITYPIMDFVRDLTNDLVIKLLFENCGRKPIDTKMRFNTATFLAIGKGKDNEVDSFIDYSSKKSDPNYPVIDVADHYGVQGGLPFLTDRQGNVNINSFYNYILIYPVKTSALYGGTGNFFVDGQRGVHHFTLGRNKGLIKKIKFSKTDMNYIREARFFRNGFDGLQQLSAVYKASIEMYGNTMYYPGMELFIDAVGIGGTDFRSTTKGSLAHILGFGGYHLVTRVNMDIAPGKFSTTVEAQWFHSGAKGDRALGPERPKNQENAEAEEDIEQKPATLDGGDDEFTTECSPLVSSLESYIEAIQEDPFADNEFHPDIEQRTPTPNTTSQNNSVSTLESEQYGDQAASGQNSSNIVTNLDDGERQ